MTAQMTQLFILFGAAIPISIFLGYGLAKVGKDPLRWGLLGFVLAVCLFDLWWIMDMSDFFVRIRADSIEYWHTSPESYEVNAVSCSKTKENRNWCEAVYRCDPYDCACDDKDCSTCYHHCPYTNIELQYIENYATGDKKIFNGHQLPENPQQHRWNVNRPIPDSIISSVGVASPTLWLEYRTQAEQGIFRPVTLQKNYNNWFMALSEEDAYFKAVDSEWVQRFANRVPELRRNPRADDSIDFLYTLSYNISLAEQEQWLYWLNHLLPAAGMELEASVRLILVEDAEALQHPDEFVAAIQADWSSQDKGAYVLPKNSVVFVLFREAGGSKILNARVFTGMPIGNEGLQNVENLHQILVGQAFEPELLLGGITTKYKNGKIYYEVDDTPGLIVDLLWGLSNPVTKFSRVSMADNFERLRHLGRPTFFQSVYIILSIWVINAIAIIFFCISVIYDYRQERYKPDPKKLKPLFGGILVITGFIGVFCGILLTGLARYLEMDFSNFGSYLGLFMLSCCLFIPFLVFKEMVKDVFGPYF